MSHPIRIKWNIWHNKNISSSPDSSRSTSRRSSSRTSLSALLANLQKENVRVLSKLSSSMPTHLHKCTCTHSCTHARTHAPTHSHTHPHQHTHHLFIAIHESAAIQRNPADSMDLFWNPIRRRSMPIKLSLMVEIASKLHLNNLFRIEDD